MNRPLILAIALGMILATTSVAQTPVDPTVEVTIGSAEMGASIDRPATYTVTVRNTSPASGSGQDPPMDVILTVTGGPDGWQPSLEQSSFQLAAGASDTTTLTIALTGEAVGDVATFTVDATIRNGAFPPFEATGTASDSVEVMRDDSTNRQVTEFVGDYLWFIVLGGVLLYVSSTALLILLFRKRDQQQKKEPKP